MSEIEAISLPVKYRPNSLSGLVGQKHIVNQIAGFYKQGRIPQSFLLLGNTGCGKTTTSRILAKLFACRNPDTKALKACGECTSCKLQNNPDIVEKNMATEGKVDDIRALVEGAGNRPMIGTKKVYVLDECHMLTGAAANALLKILEEPPRATVFILATTDPHKLLGTIKGRCHLFELKSIGLDDMAKRLRTIAKREGHDLSKLENSDKVMKLLYDLSGGSMRNAVAALDILLAALSSGEDFDLEQFMVDYMKTSEAQQEEAAANMVLALLRNDKTSLRDALTAIQSVTDCRGLVNKTRWLLQYFVDKATGTAKFTPYSAKIFAQASKEQNVKVSLEVAILLQELMCQVELRFNSIGIPENVQLYSAVGAFIANRRQ